MRLSLAVVSSAVVARYLGPDDFGLLSVALAAVGLFAGFARFGLEHIVLQDIARAATSGDEAKVLGSAFWLRFASAALTWLAAMSMMTLLDGRGELLTLVAVIGLLNLTLAWEGIESWFQVKVRMRPTSLVRMIAALVGAALRIAGAWLAAPLIWFATTTVIEGVLGVIGMRRVFSRQADRPPRLAFDNAACRRLLQQGWPLALSGLATGIYMRVDQLMLHTLAGEADVGIYSAAVRISEAWYFVPGIFVSTLFPAIAKMRGVDEVAFARRFSTMLALLSLLGVAAGIGAWLFGDLIIAVVYGTAYAPAAGVLMLHMWTGLFVGWGLARNAWLAAYDANRLVLAMTLIGLAVNVALNYVWIPKYGALGAAAATLATQAVFATVVNGLFKSCRPMLIYQAQSLLALPSVVIRLPNEIRGMR